MSLNECLGCFFRIEQRCLPVVEALMTTWPQAKPLCDVPFNSLAIQSGPGEPVYTLDKDLWASDGR